MLATYETISLLSRCKRCACLRAKEKVRGANPRESASLGEGFAFQDCGVTAASPPVKRTVRVRIPAS
jgi:hypothetical protein